MGFNMNVQTLEGQKRMGRQQLHEVKTLAELLDYVKTEKSLHSYKDLERELGISTATISEIYNGKNPHDWKILRAISDSAKISLKRVLILAGLLPADTNLPPDIEFFIERLVEAKKDDEEAFDLFIRLLYAQAAAFLDRPKQ